MNAQEAMKYLLDAPPGERVVHCNCKRLDVIREVRIRQILEDDCFGFERRSLDKTGLNGWGRWNLVGSFPNSETFAPGPWQPSKKELPENVKVAVRQKAIQVMEEDAGAVVLAGLEALYNELSSTSSNSTSS